MKEEMPISADLRGAFTLRSRLRGLLRRDAFEGVLLLAPCRDIHTFGMRFAIDVAFISSDGKVLEACRNVVPRRRLRCRGAAAVLERESDESARWYRKGDSVRLDLSC